MPQHHPAGGEDARAERRLPRGIRLGHREAADRLLDLLEDEVDDAVEDRLLVWHVAVERHRPDAESFGEAANGEGVDAGRVGEVDGRQEHAIAGQRCPALGALFGRRGHVVDLPSELHATSARGIRAVRSRQEHGSRLPSL